MNDNCKDYIQIFNGKTATCTFYVPENRKVCSHFSSGLISRSDDYSFLEDCACKCLHGNKTTEWQTAQYSKVPLLLGSRSSRVLEDFETFTVAPGTTGDCYDYHIWPWKHHFRVEFPKWQMTLPETIFYSRARSRAHSLATSGPVRLTLSSDNLSRNSTCEL